MAQTHLQQLRELRRRQVEMEAEAARRRRAAVAPTPGAATDPRRGGHAGAPGEAAAPWRPAAPLLRCQDCYYFDPVWSAILGECQANKPPPWGPIHAATWRSCAFFLSNPLGLALQVLAERWHYPEQELASALKRAAIDPARLVAGDRRRFGGPAVAGAVGAFLERISLRAGRAHRQPPEPDWRGGGRTRPHRSQRKCR